MANAVTEKTQALISALRELQKASGDTGATLKDLDVVFEMLVGVNLTNIKQSATLIADFNKQVRSMGADADTVRKLDASLLDLLQTINSVAVASDKMSALGKVGRAKQLLGQAVISGDVAEQQRQQQIIQEQRGLAEQAHETLLSVKRIWEKNLDIAKDIEEVRTRVLTSLYTRKFQRMLAPELPAGNIQQYPLLKSGMINMGAGSQYIQQPIPQYPPALPPPQQPIYPQLPAGNVVQPPLMLSAYATRPTTYIPPQPEITPEFAQQWRQNRTPVIAQPPAQLYSGIADIDNAVNERLNNVARIIDEQPSTGTKEAAENFADKTDENEPKTKKQMWDEARNQDIYKVPTVISPDVLKGIGLTDVAAKNLDKTLSALGLKEAMVTQNSTELSTGITTLSFQSINPATGAIQNFTTHIDKFGNVLADTQKRFRSFGSAVMRDVVEVLKWTIAITAIYTPIRKMGEILDEAKKIQLDMVDVQIALGNSTRDMNTVWESSAKIATQTSSAIEGVIEGYGLAVEAAASVRGENERMITTETLLKDSMILSKLAGTDQKAALDTLVGGLSQLGMSLNQGTKLLDSWVAVSKKANVSVNQMAQSFSIVGSAAEEAGLNYNELNALVGTLAQNTILSGQEIGNAIRGIVAAMQTDKAQAEFAKYGIATKTVSGDFRDLMDILRQLKVMSEAGIIDEKAMGALMQAGGAGARRGAQLAAIVENLPMVMNLITVSQDANGEAAQAMALEMGTLDAATTRLNNAFTELGVTLGGEGGILGFLTTMTNLVTGLVKGVSGLVGVLKTAAPVIATFMLARGVLGTQQGQSFLSRPIPVGLANAFLGSNFLGLNDQGKALTGMWPAKKNAPITNWLLGKTRATGIGGQYTGTGGEGEALARQATIGEFFGSMWGLINRPIGKAPITLPGMQQGNLSFGTMLGPAAIALLSNLGKPIEEAAPRAGVTIAGGILGALTGNPLIATLGATMATGFYDKFLTFNSDLAADWSRKAAELRENNAPTTNDTPEEALRKLTKQATDSLGIWENFKLHLQQLAYNVASITLPSQGTKGKQIGESEVALYLAMNQGKGAFQVFSPEVAQKFLDAYNAWVAEQASQGLIEGVEIPRTPIESAVVQQIQDLSRFAATASADMMQQAMENIAKGVSGSIEGYTTSQQLSETLASTTGNLIVAMRGAVTPAGGQVIPAVPGLPQMSNAEAIKFVAQLNSEQLQALTSALTEYIMGTNSLTSLINKAFTKGIDSEGVERLISILVELNDKTIDIKVAIAEIQAMGGIVTEESVNTMAAYVQEIAKGKTELQGFVPALQQATTLMSAQTKLKEIVEVPAMTPEQLQQVREKADEMWRAYLKASGLTDEEINVFIDSTEEQLLKIDGALSGIKIKAPQEYVNQAMEGLNITAPSFGGFQDLRSQGVTKSMLNSLMPMYTQLSQALQKYLAPLGFQLNEQYTMFNTKDGFEMLHVDNSILNMLMQDLIDVEKEKGLQGIYNLPEGATFMVPVTAYEMSKATTTEMAGGTGGFDIQSVQSMINSMIEEAKALYQQQALSQYQNTSTVEAPATRVMREYGINQPTPQPTPQVTLPYTTGNPLPVVVTNMVTPTTQLPNGTIGNFDVYSSTPEEKEMNMHPTGNTIIDAIVVAAQSLGQNIGEFSKWFNDVVKTVSPNLVAPTETQQAPQTQIPDWLQRQLAQPSSLATQLAPSALTAQVSTQAPPVTTNLNLDMNSTITLTVDGRTLATIIKPYWYQDMIRYMTSANSTINRSVIG